jgi:UDP-N-acetylmuramyl pentapeptide phosphotransferase/UDP-N-acetylglucosamine-1-phosphate transferase
MKTDADAKTAMGIARKAAEFVGWVSLGWFVVSLGYYDPELKLYYLTLIVSGAALLVYAYRPRHVYTGDMARHGAVPLGSFAIILSAINTIQHWGDIVTLVFGVIVIGLSALMVREALTWEPGEK